MLSISKYPNIIAYLNDFYTYIKKGNKNQKKQRITKLLVSLNSYIYSNICSIKITHRAYLQKILTYKYIRKLSSLTETQSDEMLRLFDFTTYDCEVKRAEDNDPYIIGAININEHIYPPYDLNLYENYSVCDFDRNNKYSYGLKIYDKQKHYHNEHKYKLVRVYLKDSCIVNGNIRTCRVDFMH